MPTLVLLIFLGLAQVSDTGTVVGIVKLPNGGKSTQAARVVLLPPKYTEVWNKQVQQRLDNYWELFKPEVFANKNNFADIDRMAHLEAMNSVTSTMRRELGSGAALFIKQTSPAGQFEFQGIPFGTYQILVEASSEGRDVVWSRSVEVLSNIPVFVDLGKPVS